MPPPAPDSCFVILRSVRTAAVTTVRTACPRCGLVDIAIGEVTVLIGSRGASVGYAFDCPSCLQPAEVPADPRALGVLFDLGARAALAPRARLTLDEEALVRRFLGRLDRTDDVAGAIERCR